jgi:hypothetical protein
LNLYKQIDDHFTIGFTGRINILQTDNRQYIGSILQKDGHVVSADYNGVLGKKALVRLIFDSFCKNNLSTVPEPEVISDDKCQFSLNKQEFINFVTSSINAIRESKKYTPPDTLKLIVNKDFIISGSKINTDEFCLLKDISEYCSVGEIL